MQVHNKTQISVKTTKKVARIEKVDKEKNECNSKEVIFVDSDSNCDLEEVKNECKGFSRKTSQKSEPIKEKQEVHLPSIKNNRSEVIVLDESDNGTEIVIEETKVNQVNLKSLFENLKASKVNSSRTNFESKEEIKVGSGFGNEDFIRFKTPEDINEVDNIFFYQHPQITASAPWLSEFTKKQSGILKLHYEILDFFEFMRPTKEEDERREQTMAELREVVCPQIKGAQIKTFGSYPCKLHLPDSDIDAVVFTSDDCEFKYEGDILDKISDILLHHDKVTYIKKIEARVPILKVRMKSTGIYMDICCNRRNGYEAKKVIRAIFEKYPHMRPLIYLIKFFLRQKGLNETFSGGVSSFLLINLLLTYIFYINKRGCEEYPTLGHILCGFFQFYGFEFNYDEVGISIRQGGFFFKKRDYGWYDERRPTTLCVENFQDTTNDIGRAAFKYRVVIDLFKMVRDKLYYPDEYPVVSYLSSFIKVDDFIKKRAKDLYVRLTSS